ncbi:uncharacterized protein LOC118171559 [Oxyura jamaicensis]|uniref:uncharacterized protein LOC118171559 n=1 Tax=Oxyura jamaicensis TaxID=8884 RepID=UPI0015A54FC6|nr:uncharacterized protein LOC118171559 [Oxyura jamaicensis]
MALFQGGLDKGPSQVPFNHHFHDSINPGEKWHLSLQGAGEDVPGSCHKGYPQEPSCPSAVCELFQDAICLDRQTTALARELTRKRRAEVTCLFQRCTADLKVALHPGREICRPRVSHVVLLATSCILQELSGDHTNRAVLADQRTYPGESGDHGNKNCQGLMEAETAGAEPLDYVSRFTDAHLDQHFGRGQTKPRICSRLPSLRVLHVLREICCILWPLLANRILRFTLPECFHNLSRNLCCYAPVLPPFM